MQKNRRTWNTIDEVREAAAKSDPQAQCYLGVCYQTGHGVPPDPVEAVKWFRLAAEQNDTVAQCYLGFCYQAGHGVPQEFGQAALWYREAAEQAVQSLLAIDTHDTVAATLSSHLTAARDRTPASTATR